jgi:DNA-binding transcriptional MerR regulator
MGLLSRFQSRRAPAPPGSAGEQWQRGVFDVEELSSQAQAVHVPGRAPRIVPAFAVDFALGCDKFRPLAEHVAEYAEKHQWDSLETAALDRLLPTLATEGLLVSSAEVRARLGGMRGTSGTISALGVPTGGPRHALVERALRSFAENFRAHGRTPDLLVADSSASPEHTQNLRARLCELRLERPIFFAGEAEKRAFCARLVKRGACSPATAEFALLDPLGTGFACGANRNTLLLHEAGRLLATVDDDVVCHLARAPEPAEEGTGLFAHTDPFARWLYANREETAAGVRADETDYLALHEALLGRGPGDLPLEPLALDQADGLLVQRLLQSDCRIRATFTGHYGDPGIPTSAYYLYYVGANRERLCASEEQYRAVFGSRAVACFAPATMIGDASVSPGMAMALDHRTLLPPFMPVLHAEDFAYGAALWQSCPGALLGHTPWGVLHDPPSGKAILQPRDLAPGRRAAFFEFAHLLRRLLFAVPQRALAPAEVRMRSLGRSLEEIGALADGDFRDLVLTHAMGEVSGRILFLSEQLEEADDAPDSWRADVEHLIAQLTGALEEDIADVPLDLQTGRTPDEARVLMQRLLGGYGALLQAWPAMVQAALELRTDGITLMQPV